MKIWYNKYMSMIIEENILNLSISLTKYSGIMPVGNKVIAFTVYAIQSMSIFQLKFYCSVWLLDKPQKWASQWALFV